MDENAIISGLEDKYIRRIQQLEKDNLDLFKEFDVLQAENKLLRKKYEVTSSGEVITEPYDAVNAERIALRKQVSKYRKRIQELETGKHKYFTSLQEKLRTIEKLKTVKGVSTVARQNIDGTGKDSVKLVNEKNKALNKKIESLETERKRQDKKIRNLERKLESSTETLIQHNPTLINGCVIHCRNLQIREDKETLHRATCKSNVATFRSSKYLEPLPVIKKSLHPSYSSSIFGTTDYFSLYKRRLSLMSSHNSASDLSCSLPNQ